MVVIGIPLPYYLCFSNGEEDEFWKALVGQSIAVFLVISLFSVKILLKMQTLYYYSKTPPKLLKNIELNDQELERKFLRITI